MPTTQTPAALVQAGTKIIGGNSTFPTGAPAPALEPVKPVDNTPLIITKFQFRKLFTLAERTTIDNIQYNTNFSGSVKAVINTIMNDLNVSGNVDLHLPDVIQGITFLKQVGILSTVRAARILNNLPPL